MSENKKIDLENLEQSTGGNYGGPNYDPVHDLNNFGYHMVGNLPAGECLVMQAEPCGPFLGIQYWNGDSIFINEGFYERGYRLAYQNGTFGFVDAHYVL